MRTKVVGVSFINDDGSNRANIISKMDENSKVFLERDPYNQYDSNAVKVLVIQDGEKKQIGFLGKDMASSISTKMKSGTQYDVSVVACGEYMDRPFCEINVEEKDAITQKDDNTVAAPRRHIIGTTQQPTKPKEKHIIIPEKNTASDNVISYLKSRGIDEEIIKECIEKKLIYEEKHYHNAVFLGYDDLGNIKYAGCRSTNETIFKQDATGSDKSYSFRLESNTKTDTIYIFEGAIDALSYATFLKLYGMDYKAKTLISLAGIYQPASDISKSKIPLAIQRYLDKHPETKNIFLCFDNDKAGRKASKALQIVLADKYTVVTKPPKGP